jgi:hypothetical protein
MSDLDGRVADVSDSPELVSFHDEFVELRSERGVGGRSKRCEHAARTLHEFPQIRADSPAATDVRARGRASRATRLGRLHSRDKASDRPAAAPLTLQTRRSWAQGSSDVFHRALSHRRPRLRRNLATPARECQRLGH